jgi:transposase InsO family protein
VGVRRLWRLLKEANCQSVMTKKYRKPVTEVLSAQRPNLIKQLNDQSGVWSADVTYIRVPNGQYMYLGTVYDPENLKVLAHQLSSVRDGRFASDILLEALSSIQNRLICTVIWGSSTRVVSLTIYWRQIAFATPIPRKDTPMTMRESRPFIPF